jgi:hypothetical protein
MRHRSRNASTISSRPDRDGAVRDVECREIRRAPVRVDEIDHVAVDDAVHDVAEGAAKNERQRQRQQFLTAGRAPDPDDQHDAHHATESYEEPALPARSPGQHAERRARVVQQREIEHRQHYDPVVQLQESRHHELGRLVECDHRQRDPQPGGRMGALRWRRHRSRQGDRLPFGRHLCKPPRFTRSVDVAHATCA